MSHQQLRLETLSNREIKELWEKTQNERRKQIGYREAESRAATDMLDHDGDYYKDAFGNMIEGKRPAPKTVGTYVDANGYVQELKPGEQPPEPGSGDNLRDWLKTVDIANDPEVRAAVGEDAIYFETELDLHDDKFCIVGQLESDGWLVTSRSQDGKSKDLKFRLSRSLAREEAIKQAEGYVKLKAGPQFKDLTDDQLRIAERMAATDRLGAFVYFVKSRLPVAMADRLLELAQTGNEAAIQEFCADEKISAVVEEGVRNSFFWSNPRCTEDFFHYVSAHDGGRVWTFLLLDNLWQQYQVSSALDKLDAKHAPTLEELDAMSDEQVEQTLLEARKLRAAR